MRKKLLVSLAALGLALLAGSGTAQADDDVRFGIRPTQASEDRPQTFSYFSHELSPGAVLTDEALVMNSGDAPVTLKLYAADGITAINASIAFAKQDQESTGASRGTNRWLSLSVTEIPLEPGEEIVAPFTITVPPDASPGHHVAGLVVEAPPSEGAPTGEGGGQFAVNVIQQAGVAVVIDVPGPHVAGLGITGTCLKQQDDQGATFEIDVDNTGNIFVKGEGSYLITDHNGEELASIPLKMNMVLPGDATTFQVTHPLHLADGDYLVGAALDYEGNPAVIEGVEIKIKDGEPEVGGCEPEEEEGPFPPTDITEIGPPPAEDGGPPIGLYAACAATVLALGLAAAAVIAWRRKRGMRAQ